MKALALIAAFSLCLAAFGADPQGVSSGKPASEIVSKPKFEPYLDESTGVEFPAKIGSFVKSQVVKNANPYYGTVVRYGAHDGSCADIYIYSLGSGLDQEQLSLHFKSVVKVIESMPASKVGPVKEVSFKDEAKLKLGAKGSFEAYRADFSFEAAGLGFDSSLAVFAFKDKVVKLRISRPSGLKIDVDSFISSVARLFEQAEERSGAQLKSMGRP